MQFLYLLEYPYIPALFLNTQFQKHSEFPEW